MLISQTFMDHLTPHQARRLFDLITTFNDERDDMDPTIAKVCDDLDAAINRM